MCGIAGMSGTIDAAILAAMNLAQAHRGPDGSGQWFRPGGGAALAHRRLAIIDLTAASDQPLTVDELGLTIVFNGEIYNFRELRTVLEQRGHRFRSAGDTEVLVRHVAEFGIGGLTKLRGIFAAAIARHDRDEITLIRDRFGVKPLYLAETPGRISFASELKAILMDPAVPRSLDLQSVADTVRHLWPSAPRTMLAGVQQVEPGHALVLRAGRIVSDQRYWDLDVGRVATVRRRPAELHAEIAERFRIAVGRQLVSDVPVGTLFSGGTDSTAITAAALESGRLDHAFTADLGEELLGREGFESDTPHARAAATRLGIDWVPVDGSGAEPGELAETVWSLDEVHADPAAILTVRIARAARARGCIVLLSGAGGDDVFTGYRRHRALYFDRLAGVLPSPLRRAAASAGRRLPAGRAGTRRIGKLLATVDADRAGRIVGLFDWLAPDLVAGTLGAPGTAVSPAMATTLDETRPDAHAVEACLRLEQRHFLADHNLAYVDRMSMAAGVEVRVPFLDDDLVDFAATIPAGQLMPRGIPKALLADALGRWVPPEVGRRRKAGFGMPLRSQLNRELKASMDELLSERSLRERGVFRPAAVTELRRLDEQGRVDAAYPLFAIALIELWCRTFLDRADTSRPLSW